MPTDKATAKSMKDAHIPQLRKEVEWFAELMEQKLCQNDWKDHWANYSAMHMFDMLVIEMDELSESVTQCDHLSIINEATDVANFAMMVADIAKQEIESSGKKT